MPKFLPAVLCLRTALAEQVIKTRLLILIAALFGEEKKKKKASFLKNVSELCTCILRLAFSKVPANYICAQHSNSGWLFSASNVYQNKSLTAAPTAAGNTTVCFS